MNRCVTEGEWEKEREREKGIALRNIGFEKLFRVPIIHPRHRTRRLTGTKRGESAPGNNYGFLLLSARSIFLSAESRKFIHYTVVRQSAGQHRGPDSWIANPIEDSSSAPAANKIVFHPFAGENFVPASLALSSSSFSRPLFLFPRRKLVHQSSPAPIFLLECCCRRAALPSSPSVSPS